MTTLSKANVKDIGDIVVKAIQKLVPQIINEQVPKIINEQVPKIINEQLDLIKQVQGNQSIMLRTLMTDTSHLKQLAREQGILYEDLEHRFTTLAEAVDEHLTVRSILRDHESRLTTLESTQSLPRSAGSIQS